MTNQDNELREKIEDIFRSLIINYTDGRGSYKRFQMSPESEEVAGRLEAELVTLIRSRERAAEVRGASKAAEVINKEIGVEMTTNGLYYVDNIRLQKEEA